MGSDSDDKEFETSLTRSGFDLATNRWSFSPNHKKTKLQSSNKVTRTDDEIFDAFTEDKASKIALSKSNKSFQSGLKKMRKRRNASLRRERGLSQTTMENLSSCNSDDFDNDDIQEVRRRSSMKSPRYTSH